MKYIPIPDFETVTNALNFSNPDIHVIGGCDVYTTKAAGDDIKLYESIENKLQSQHQALVRLSASLSPPNSAASSPSSPVNGSRSHASVPPRPTIDLSRPSPFGSLHQSSARKTFKYLIATLNASHQDYDFSYKLQPTDFRKERSLTKVMTRVNSTLHNLRPRRHFYSNAYLAPPSTRISRSAPRPNSLAGNDLWDPQRMWAIIDKDISLRQCEKYSYAPSSDLFEDEEGALWSMHYFFFNKKKKRLIYLYLRGLSVISHSPVISAPIASHHHSKVGRSSVAEGAGKRSSYWFGDDQAPDVDGYADDDDDEVNEVPWMDLDEIRGDIADGFCDYEDDVYDAWMDDGWMPIRGVSEEVGAVMEL